MFSDEDVRAALQSALESWAIIALCGANLGDAQAVLCGIPELEAYLRTPEAERTAEHRAQIEQVVRMTSTTTVECLTRQREEDREDGLHLEPRELATRLRREQDRVEDAGRERRLDLIRALEQRGLTLVD